VFAAAHEVSTGPPLSRIIKAKSAYSSGLLRIKGVNGVELVHI